MHRKSSVLAVGILTASLSGCQLVQTLMLEGTGGPFVGGVCGQYQVVATDEQAVTPEILEQTRSIIEKRVDSTGVADAMVVTLGEDRISVELPGVDDATEIRSLIGTTGVLEFTPVPQACAPEVYQDAPMPECLAEVEPLFNGTEVDVARIGQDQQTGEIVVYLELKDTGSRLFDEYAAEVYDYPDPQDRLFAIVFDDAVASAPSINAPRFDGQAQISSNFTPEEASNLVTVLRFGSLPLEVREVGFGACEVAAE
jgi:protein-export membrane protein SecD